MSAKKAYFRCGNGLGPRAVEARSQAENLVRNYHAGPLTRLRSRGRPGFGTPVGTPELATYASVLGIQHGGGPEQAIVAVLGYEFGAGGQLLDRPSEQAFQDGIIELGEPVAGCQLYVGAQPGVGANAQEQMVALTATAAYLASTTQSRILSTVPRGELAEMLGSATGSLALPILPTPPDMLTFEWKFDDVPLCRLAADALAAAQDTVFQPRILLQLQTILDKLSFVSGRLVELRAC